jgi:regulator of protease activity HflC (stomatin/prohibitin superfamily)
MFTYGLTIGLVLGLVLLSRKCAFRVEEGHLAVVVRFGAALTEPGGKGALRTFGPGAHAKWPWDHVLSVSMKEQNLDLAGDDDRRSVMTPDGTILRFESILRYAPDQAQLSQFLFGLARPVEHVTELFTCLLRNEIANFHATSRPGDLASSNAVDEGGGSYALLRRERKLIHQRIEEFSRKEIGDRYGVRFSAVDLKDILPPDELADALNAVMVARAEADAAYFRAESECQQRLLAAEQGVDISTTRAQANETEILTLGHHLAELESQQVLDLYVERRRREVMSESRTVFFKEPS